MAALTAAAQGGPEGVRAIIEARLEPVIGACTSGDSRVCEAAADLLCQLASEEDSRAALSMAGAIAALVALLTSTDAEIQIRALMGLGMLLPGSPANQKAVAQDRVAIKRLMVGEYTLIKHAISPMHTFAHRSSCRARTLTSRR